MKSLFFLLLGIILATLFGLLKKETSLGGNPLSLLVRLQEQLTSSSPKLQSLQTENTELQLEVQKLNKQLSKLVRGKVKPNIIMEYLEDVEWLPETVDSAQRKLFIIRELGWLTDLEHMHYQKAAYNVIHQASIEKHTIVPPLQITTISEERLEQIEQLIYGPPTEDILLELSELLHMQDPDEVAALLPKIEQGVQSWPDEYFTAPSEWINAYLSNREVPRLLELCREFDFYRGANLDSYRETPVTDKIITNFVSSPLIRNAKSLDIHITDHDVRRRAMQNFVKTKVASSSLPDSSSISVAQLISELSISDELIPESSPTGKSLSAIARSPYCSSLESIRFELNTVGRQGIIDLAYSPYMKNLRHLELSGFVMSGEIAQAIAESPYLKNLVELWISADTYTRVTSDEEGEKIAYYLARSKNFSNLESLYLRGLQLGNSGVKEIISSQNLGALRSLWLPKNNIGILGAKSIAQSPLTSQLESLGLSNNRIRDSGAISLASSKHLSSLKKLDISSNEIKARGRDALSRSQYISAFCEVTK